MLTRTSTQPPQSFQPPLPVASSSNSAFTASISSQQKPLQPDLITRYNLKSKLAEDGASESSASEAGDVPSSGARKGQAWSSNKVERQALLQRRRDEMILAARRKMEAKVAEEALRGQES
jgi:coupling of ubiquitin conjugation to ER degradation protein 1